MDIYFAPMEGITLYQFRRAYEEAFPGVITKYFAPFISSGVRKGVAGKDLKQLSPENNQGILLVPQLLTRELKDFEATADALMRLGYEEINLNFGCPSQTVVSKGRGAGMLADTEHLNRFLDGAISFCEKRHISLSVKTRLGLAGEEEFYPLLSIYERYPLKELIIHLRLRNDYYKLPCHRDCFDYAVQNSSQSLVYNGDILSLADINEVQKRYPGIGAVMIGRGLLKNPCMLYEQAGEADMKKESAHIFDPKMNDRLWKFHDSLYASYREDMSGDRNVLFKMKEIWTYLGERFDTEDEQGRCNHKALKQIRKSQSLSDYDSAVGMLRAQHR